MNIENLDRTEMLSKLHSLPFRMSLTALTSEGCIEVNVVSSKGTSYSWESFEDYTSHIYCLKGLSKNKIALIKEHIASKTFFIADLSRTQLKKIICEDRDQELSDIFVNFPELPDQKIESVYCYRETDTGLIYVSDTEEKLSNILNDRYPIDKPWESYSDEQLADYLEENEGQGCEIPYTSFD